MASFLFSRNRNNATITNKRGARWNFPGRSLLMICCWIVLLAQSKSASAQSQSGTNLPVRIEADWNKRRSELGAISYRLVGTRTWLRVNSSSTNATIAGPSGKLESNLILDFGNNRCRIENLQSHYSDENKVVFGVRVVTVGYAGGASLQIIENSNPSLVASNKADMISFYTMQGDRAMLPRSLFDELYLYPPLFGSGRVSTPHAQPKTVDIDLKLDPATFVNCGRFTNQGRPYVILRSDYEVRYAQTNFFVVDLERDSAVVSFVIQTGGSNGLMSSCDIDYSLKSGHWLPDHWTVRYSDRGLVSRIEEVTAVETTVLSNPSAESFSLHPEAGMNVREMNYSLDPQTMKLVVSDKQYRAAVNGTREEVKTSKVAFDIGRSKPPNPNLARLLLFIAAFGFPVVLWLFSRNSTSSKKPQ